MSSQSKQVMQLESREHLTWCWNPLLMTYALNKLVAVLLPTISGAISRTQLPSTCSWSAAQSLAVLHSAWCPRPSHHPWHPRGWQVLKSKRQQSKTLHYYFRQVPRGHPAVCAHLPTGHGHRLQQGHQPRQQDGVPLSGDLLASILA